MNGKQTEFDLVYLAAAKNEAATLKVLLDRRHASLGIRPIRQHGLVHPRRDPGCLRGSAAVLETFLNRASRAMVVFDWEGSGREQQTASELESQVERDLEQAGWANRCAAIVIAPELESWMFADSDHVPRALGFDMQYDEFVQMIVSRGYQFAEGKPERPKELVETLLQENRIQRSSALYAAVAEKVSLNRCRDRSFAKLRSKLVEWFSQ